MYPSAHDSLNAVSNSAFPPTVILEFNCVLGAPRHALGVLHLKKDALVFGSGLHHPFFAIMSPFLQAAPSLHSWQSATSAPGVESSKFVPSLSLPESRLNVPSLHK